MVGADVITGSTDLTHSSAAKNNQFEPDQINSGFGCCVKVVNQHSTI